MNRSDLQKLIDCCRSDADLQLPEFQPLAEMVATDPVVQRSWEKSQQMDAEIRQTIRDVAVPAGLQDRLLAALAHPVAVSLERPKSLERPNDFAAQAASTVIETSDDIQADATLAGDAPSIVGPDRKSNWKAWSVACAGIAALVLVSVSMWPTSEPSLATEDDARTQALQWIAHLDSAQWQLSNPPTAFPLPTQLRKRPSGWQDVSPRPGSLRVVCYDLSSAGPKALLFVAWTRQQSNLAMAPPANAYPKEKWRIAVWKANSGNGSLVYLLAVETGSNQYPDLIRGPSPLAALAPAGRHDRPARGLSKRMGVSRWQAVPVIKA